MSDFKQVLERLSDAVSDRRQQAHATVQKKDLRELLHHFYRLDADARLGYPAHVKMVADAAEKAVKQLDTRDPVRGELEYALDLSRPNRRASQGERDE